jgi:hypothetical protein
MRKIYFFVSRIKNPATNYQQTKAINSKQLNQKKMKNFLIAFAGSIFVLATTTGANAQNSNDLDKSVIKINQSVFPTGGNALNAGSFTVNFKALKDFKKSYKDANGEIWLKNEFGLTARFTAKGINNLIYYDKKGNWTASLKTYNEDKFDRSVRAIVKQKYYDYKITQVQEIETTATLGAPTYMVHIEGDNDFKIIRVTDGAMDVYEEFGKQK